MQNGRVVAVKEPGDLRKRLPRLTTSAPPSLMPRVYELLKPTRADEFSHAQTVLGTNLSGYVVKRAIQAGGQEIITFHYALTVIPIARAQF